MHGAPELTAAMSQEAKVAADAARQCRKEGKCNRVWLAARDEQYIVADCSDVPRGGVSQLNQRSALWGDGAPAVAPAKANE